MKTFKKINQSITGLIIAAVIGTAAYLWLNDPSVFYTQTYVLLDWLGLAALAVVISYKLSGFAGLFLNTKKAGIFMAVQLVLCPIIINYLSVNYGLPVTVASAIAFAAVSPGFIPSNIIVNLFMAACMFFLSIYVLPYSSVQVNEVYQTIVSPVTRYFLMGVAVLLFIYKFFKHQEDNVPEERPKSSYSQYIHVKA